MLMHACVEHTETDVDYNNLQDDKDDLYLLVQSFVWVLMQKAKIVFFNKKFFSILILLKDMYMKENKENQKEKKWQTTNYWQNICVDCMQKICGEIRVEDNAWPSCFILHRLFLKGMQLQGVCVMTVIFPKS